VGVVPGVKKQDPVALVHDHQPNDAALDDRQVIERQVVRVVHDPVLVR